MLYDIFLIIITSLSVAFGAFSFFGAIRTRKRQERTINIIRRENEAFNYYLKTEIPKNVQDRYLQNLNNFSISTFDYENIDRLLFEMRKLRSEIRKLSDNKDQKNIQTPNKNDKNDDFNYNELILQISNMTNIQYLFELLKHQKDDQFEYIKNVLSDIVHTIRNPLSGIRAVLGVIKLDYSHDAKIMEKIIDLEDYIDELENNLNAYYQISSISTSLEEASQKLSFKNELDLRGKLLTISLGKKIELRNRIDEIELDKNTIEILMLAITCIWENAISFSKDNGIIKTETTLNDNVLTIEITNDGPIIKQELLNKIFEQGFSTRDSTGRGLAIVKQAIEKTLNGIIVCENIGQENGVKFTIVLEVKNNNE